MWRSSNHRAEGSFSGLFGFIKLLLAGWTNCCRFAFHKKSENCTFVQWAGQTHQRRGGNANLAGKEAIRITEILSFSPVCEYKWILCTQLAYICTISVVTRHSCFSFWTWRLLL